MTRHRMAWTAALAWAASANAQILELSVDRLDAGDPGGPAPSHLLVIDTYISMAHPMDDYWTASGLRLDCSSGARFRYAYSDPNNPNAPTIVSPGESDRLVTCFSEPHSRESQTRFNDYAGAAIGGAYCPPGADAVATDSHLNVIWFHSPPHTHSHGNGYIARIVLDLTDTPYDSDDLTITTERPETWVLAADCPDEFSLPGFVATTRDFPQLVGFDWWVTVPEPATIALLIAGAALLRIRKE